MTNGKAITTLMLILAFLILLPLSLAETRRIWNMTQPQPQQEPAKWVNVPESRYQQTVNMAVMWRTPKADGMAPQQVLEATSARMQYEQGTELGSDKNARALVKAMEALAILEDRPTETKDGFPIIE